MTTRDTSLDTAGSRLMVLLFTDLVGSVKLKAELGLAAYARLLARHDALFRSIIDTTPGAEVRQDTGDGFYAAFATPAGAVAAAIRFQVGLSTGDWDPRPPGARTSDRWSRSRRPGPTGTRSSSGSGPTWPPGRWGSPCPGRC